MLTSRICMTSVASTSWDSKVRVASHQPNFLGWVGWWNKYASSNVFVLSGGVKFSKSEFTHRVPHKDGWLTLPIVRETMDEPIYKVKVARNQDLWKLQRRLELEFACKRMPYRERVEKILSAFDHWKNSGADDLYSLNSELILNTAEVLDLDVEVFGVMHQGAKKDETKTQALRRRLATIMGSSRPYLYLAGRGALNYLNPEEFKDEIWVQKMNPDTPKGTVLQLIATEDDPLAVIDKSGGWLPYHEGFQKAFTGVQGVQRGQEAL